MLFVLLSIWKRCENFAIFQSCFGWIYCHFECVFEQFIGKCASALMDLLQRISFIITSKEYTLSISLCMCVYCSLFCVCGTFEKYCSWYAWVCKCNALLLCQCHLFCYPFWRGLSYRCSTLWRWADKKQRKMCAALRICALTFDTAKIWC